ncbi:MAG: hypothetical protein Q8P41_24480 [Pseudomonadota bacterium]|nr:hypothetical protein [Pseudomonadota bacterium]
MLLLVAAAWAAFPEDVSITAMDEFAGASTYLPDTTQAGNDFVVTGYQTMVKELGTAIANKPMAPGESLGMNGFQVGIANTFAFVRTGSTDGTHPTGWDLADADEDPQTYLFIPWLQVRKGLPASLEIGANAGWIGLTRTGVFGVYGRWSVLEGYRRVPDLALQVGYAGYVGNDELELGVMDMSATLGYSLPFGVTQGINQAVFSPYVGIGLNRIHAAPRGDLSRTDLEGRITEVSGFKADTEHFVEGFVPVQIGGGFRIVNGDFAATLAATYSPGLIATVNLGFGFVY